jgi:gluconolactonase
VTTLARSAIATTINGLPFNSPNDVVVRSDGTIYFSDPSWQNGGRASVGILAIYVVSPAGQVTQVTTPFSQINPGGPNGVALSLDEQSLYVTGNGAPGSQIKVFPVALDGNLGTPTDFPPAAPLTVASDGMTLDCAGNLYVALPDVIVVYSPTGAELGRIMAAGNAGPTNAAFGGPTGTTLYITALGQGIAQLSFVELNVPGLPY